MKEIKSKSLKNNFVFQVLYQIIILVLPMLTAPYLTRTLSTTDLGTYTYVNSIAFYFVLISNLGISQYGQRLFSNFKSEKEEVRKNFWSLYYVHFITTIFSTIMYIIFALLVFKNNKIIFLIQTIYVLSALFDVTWFFYGIQNFLNVVIVNFVFKILYTLSIFLFIKNPEDINLYVILSSLVVFVPNFFNFVYAIIHYGYIKIEKKYCLIHIKPLLVLSLAEFASALYTVFDKTIIGLYMKKDEVAYYDYANKILAIPKSLINVVGIVFFPKVCSLVSANREDEAKKLRNFSIELVTFLSMGSIYGLFLISDRFVIWYYGREFIKSAEYLKIMIPLIYIILLGDIFRRQCLIPHQKDTIYIISLFISGLLNLILNLIFVIRYGVVGVIISSIAAELCGTIFQWYFSRKYVSNVVVFKTLTFFVITGLFMILPIKLLNNLITNNFAFVLASIVSGGIIYSLFNLLYFLKISDNKELFSMKLNHLLRR